MKINPLLSTGISLKNTNYRGVRSNASVVPFKSKNIVDNVQINKKENKSLKKTLIVAISAAVAVVAAAFLLLKNKLKPKDISDITKKANPVDAKKANTKVKTDLVKDIKKTNISKVSTPIDTTKLDIEYKNGLVQGLKETYGINKNVSDVQSVMGKEELQVLLQKLEPNEVSYHENSADFLDRTFRKYLLEEVKPEDRYTEPKNLKELNKYINEKLSEEEIEKYFEPLINKRCRIFLEGLPNKKIENPKDAAIDFLQNAVAYADKVAQKVSDDKPPFTIGITDKWDTAIQQEVVKEIAENPEKYKNLKVVINFQQNMFIDPFNKELNQAIQKRDIEQIEFLKKSLKEKLVVLPENYKDEDYSFCKSMYNKKRNLNIEGARMFNDEDWEKIINDPDVNVSRDRRQNQKQLIKEKIFDKYILPHYTEDSVTMLSKNGTQVEKDSLYNRIIENTDDRIFGLSKAKDLEKIALKQKQTSKFVNNDGFQVYTLHDTGTLYEEVELYNGMHDRFIGAYQSRCQYQTKNYFDENGNPINKLFTKSLTETKQDAIKKGFVKDREWGRDSNAPADYIDPHAITTYWKSVPPIAYKQIIQNLFSQDGKKFTNIAGSHDYTEFIFGDDVILTKKIWDKIISN